MSTATSATATGRFGAYGGRYVPETLMPAIGELERAYAEVRDDAEFQAELSRLHRTYTGRPTPITFAQRLTEAVRRRANLSQARGSGAYRRAQDQQRAGPGPAGQAHGQAPHHRRDRRRPARRGHATVCALLGLECVVYMGTEDMARQRPNVFRMRLLGAEVRGVDTGSRTLKDAINEAMRDWVANPDSYYLLGSALGPHPYPTMVRDFQAVIGREARVQMLELTGRLPDVVVACVGGGSNAIGIFHPFFERRRYELRRRRGRRLRHRVQQARGAVCRAACPACCRARTPTCCRTRTARSR